MNVSVGKTVSIVNCTDKEYFALPQVSNSDINWVKEQTSGRDVIGDKEKAYAFGSLFDGVTTESHRVDFFNNTFDGEPVDDSDWRLAIRMRKSFLADSFCLTVYKEAKTQVVMVREVELDFQGVKFVLPMRCKWDFFIFMVNYGADLKSTTATSQEQFEAVIEHFNYDQQMAVYMNVAEIDYVVLLGVSKVNFKVFKKVIKRGDDLYESGMNKLRYWGWKYHTLFY